MCICTAQSGYCDSDVTVCLLFWVMPTVQNREIKFPYEGYTNYLQPLCAKSSCGREVK